MAVFYRLHQDQATNGWIRRQRDKNTTILCYINFAVCCIGRKKVADNILSENNSLPLQHETHTAIPNYPTNCHEHKGTEFSD